MWTQMDIQDARVNRSMLGHNVKHYIVHVQMQTVINASITKVSLSKIYSNRGFDEMNIINYIHASFKARELYHRTILFKRKRKKK